jgi:outer membrane cobalamin receptor
VSALQESIVVSASHVETPLSRLPTSATVVGAAELRALQAESVSEALQLVPGLQVARSGGRLGLTSVFPRGGESDFTLVAIDGLRVNSFGGGFDFATLPLCDVERIEVVRGPQSAVFGADAIGGLVQVVTRSGGPLRLHALAEGGGFGTARAEVSAAGTFSAVRWGAAVERSVSTASRAPRRQRARRQTMTAARRQGRDRGVRAAPSRRAHVRAGSTTRGFGPFGAIRTARSRAWIAGAGHDGGRAGG